MGALPKKKITRARRGQRQTSYKLRPIHPSVCSHCRSAKLPHTVCPQCGYYRGRQIVGAEG
ncbi:MAG: 50S ribosomal protein L32 [Chloroflexi bacterium]|nr:50S ribosomal protein L32 [Chloroflexota bacterium]MCH8348720.1 50S ribosomal protein L32 [Chloroflexota bacterium]MCI0780666.1 50S ribosomal protein L32 [Chloroflexota bacterium]MCI0785678.1 50S ribosomal protein L32 [Chloroflexota bacterium]MCI0793989.1 50S ribosomal protein L32 [Chloroflexota bacterium]